MHGASRGRLGLRNHRGGRASGLWLVSDVLRREAVSGTILCIGLGADARKTLVSRGSMWLAAVGPTDGHGLRRHDRRPDIRAEGCVAFRGALLLRRVVIVALNATVDPA